ncbi:MAG: S4 domain-containing protein [Candidatus Marinimicrobia bacterium]|nr:S4 domain-containing protein [Candidatus Neomarinimicrobiota bacterium]
MRLNKFLAHCGVDSRRNCDEIIFQGRVQVNGETFTNPGARIDPEHSEILVDGEPVSLKSHYTYIKLHKPGISRQPERPPSLSNRYAITP